MLLRNAPTVFLLFLFIGALVADASLQQVDEVSAALDQARRLERLNRHEEALAIHRQLYDSHPQNPHVLAGIERNLLRLRKYSELVDFLEGLLKENPTDQSLQEKLGDALYKSGQEAEAEEVWSRLIDQAPDDENAYARVARQYLYNGRINESVATYQLGRKRVGKPSLFAMDLGRLYDSQMEFEKAAREYMSLLEEDPKQYSLVENAIGRFKLTDDSDVAVTGVLEEAVEEHPDNPQFRRLLGSRYLGTAQPERAFEQFVKVEEIERANGGTLIDFADWSYREGFYSTALEAYRRILELYPESPLAPKVFQGAGRSLAKMGRFQEAISMFESLTANFANSKESENSLFEIGRIQLEELGQVDLALSAFKDLVRARKQSQRSFDAMFYIGDCYLVKGDLDSARQEYERVGERAGKSAEIAEKAAFKVAETKYFEGDFDGVLEELETLVKVHPKGVYVNDALALMVFIEENRMTGDDALRAFAKATLLERRKETDEAIEAYQQISTRYPHSFLGDDALLKIGAIHNGQNSFEMAIETYRTLLATYPSSDLCDETQRRIGEIYEVGLQDLPRAIEAYDEVLSKYPDSLLFDSVRKRIRALQARVGATG